MKAFVTGTAGFIGYHLAMRLLADGHEVLGYDGMTPYYDVAMKRVRHARLSAFKAFTPVEALLEDARALSTAMTRFDPEVVIHLAAQAGVRYGLDHPDDYISSNVAGTMNVLEAARRRPPRHLLIASTSSVYGANEEMPFTEVQRTDHPVSLYAASKKAAEALSHAYSGLFAIPVTCFRFFTVYGPWGRPDMALFKFVSAIESGQPIGVYGNGHMQRDFTYVDDLIEAVIKLVDAPPRLGEPVTEPGVMDSLSPVAPWRVVNIAQGQPVGLLRFIEVIEQCLGRRAMRLMEPMQQGDVVSTWADPSLLRALTGYVPSTSVEEGVGRFVEWYREWTSLEASSRATRG